MGPARLSRRWVRQRGKSVLNSFDNDVFGGRHTHIETCVAARARPAQRLFAFLTLCLARLSGGWRRRLATRYALKTTVDLFVAAIEHLRGQPLAAAYLLLEALAVGGCACMVPRGLVMCLVAKGRINRIRVLQIGGVLEIQRWLRSQSRLLARLVGLRGHVPVVQVNHDGLGQTALRLDLSCGQRCGQ